MPPPSAAEIIIVLLEKVVGENGDALITTGRFGNGNNLFETSAGQYSGVLIMLFRPLPDCAWAFGNAAELAYKLAGNVA